MSEARERLVTSLTVRPEPFTAAGVSVHVRRMTLAERRSFMKDHNAREDKGETYAERLFLAGVCDESGRLLFGPDEAEALADFDGALVEAVAQRVHDLNGFGGGDPKAQTPSGPTPS